MMATTHSYGPHALQCADVYTPAGDMPDGGWPWVLWLHGGGWWTGDKTDLLEVALSPLQFGCAVVSANYRLSTVAPWPVMSADVAACVRWAKANAETLGLSPTQVGAWGQSAGGHLALILGAFKGRAPGIEALRGDMQDHMDQTEDVLAVCAWSAPSAAWVVDQDASKQMQAPYFGPKNGRIPICGRTTTQEAWMLGGYNTGIDPCANQEAARFASPLRWIVDAIDPLPAYRLEHGVRAQGVGGDASVPVGQMHRVRDRLLAKGATFIALERPGVTHSALTWIGADYHTEAAQWLAQQLGA